MDAVGANSKMNEFQAAMGLCNLRHVDGEIAKRRAVALRYRERLSEVPGICLVKEQADVKQNYAYFPVVFEPGIFGCDRDAVYDALKEKHIFTRKYFYPTTNSFACYRNHYDPADTPVALAVSKKVLTLPMYADLRLEQVDMIFYPTTNSFACYRNHYDPADTPVALAVSKKVLTLPMYADLRLEQVDMICDEIIGVRR